MLKKNRRSAVVWRFIATLAATVAIIVSVFHFNQNSNKPQLIFVNIDPVLAKQEVELVNQIRSYTAQIKDFNVDLSNLPTSQSELEYIDKLIEKYSSDLKQFGPNPRLLESLMDLYQKKIKVLERMLNEIEKSKNYEKRKIVV